MRIYNKLVRDKIPEIIKETGENPNFETLSNENYIAELDKKLNEEVTEYQQSKGLDELADTIEVIYAISKARGYCPEELERVRAEKKEKRGGFEKKIFLKSVE